MKFITAAIEKKLDRTPIGSTDGQGADAQVIVKFFNPYGAGTWLVTEAERDEDGSFIFYGAAHIHGWEWGYFSERELRSLRKFGRPQIERDIHFSGTVRTEWRDAA